MFEVTSTMAPRRDHLHYFLSFLLGLLPWVACGWARRHKWFFLISVLWVLPLYFIGCDYGRWNHILIVGMTIHWLALDVDAQSTRTWLRFPHWIWDVALLVWCSTWSSAMCNNGFRHDVNLLTQVQAIITGLAGTG
jgi:hypothetical protein